jgi:putative PIN family toxin of toxin-antitoxin system
MKVVIDTNILLSAAWRDKKPEAVVLWIATHPDWDWMVSEEILSEYREVLRREKFNIASEKLQRWERIITKLTTLIDVSLEVDFPRDQKDAKFLACALISAADYFITGDRDFSEAKTLTKTKIMSVSEFLEKFVSS